MNDDMRDLSDLAGRVAGIYAARFGAPDTSEFVLAKMTEELGEVTGAFLQMRGHGRGAATQADLADEVADLLGFLLVFCAREGIDPAAALRSKWGAYLPDGVA